MDDNGDYVVGSKFPLHFVTNKKEIRNGYPSFNSKWQVVSSVLFHEDWEQYLIVQTNNHACGPVSILQLLHLLGYDIGFLRITQSTETNFANKLLAEPKFSSLVSGYIKDCVNHSSDLAKHYNTQEESNQSSGLDARLASRTYLFC